MKIKEYCRKTFNEIPMTHYGYHKFKVKNHIPQQAKIPPFSGKEIKIQIENDELLKGFFLLIDSKLESLESQKNSDYYTLKINLIKNKNRKIKKSNR